MAPVKLLLEMSLDRTRKPTFSNAQYRENINTAVAFKDSPLNKGTALTSLKRDLDLTMFVSSSDWPKLLEADHLACYSEDSCGSINSLLVLKKFLINKLSCKKIDFK